MRPRLQAKAFHWLLRRLFGHAFTDLVCRVRAFRRQVIEDIALHGSPDFLPLLASERGFRIREVDVRAGRTGRAGVQLVVEPGRRPARHSRALSGPKVHEEAAPVLRHDRPADSVRRASVQRRPGDRQADYGVPLADRPALILAVLLIVLGIQILALGLIGELVIFASGRRIGIYDRADRRHGQDARAVTALTAQRVGIGASPR